MPRTCPFVVPTYLAYAPIGTFHPIFGSAAICMYVCICMCTFHPIIGGAAKCMQTYAKAPFEATSAPAPMSKCYIHTHIHTF